MSKEKDILYVIHNEQIMDTDTGELLTEEEFHERFQDTLTEKIRDYKRACKQIEKMPQLAIRKLQGNNYACVPIKNKNQFNKVFRVDMKELLLGGHLGKNELAFIGFFTSFINFPTNEIIFNNEYLTLDEMGRLIGVGKNAINNTIKTLEKCEVIKCITRHKQSPIIYFNPFLYCSGKVTEYDTYMMFIDSIYNPKLSNDEEDNK